MESRFINKATMEYMKSKAGATNQQQLNALHQAVIEQDGQNQTVQNQLNFVGESMAKLRSELVASVSNLRELCVDEMEERLKDKNQAKYATEDLIRRVDKLTRSLIYGAIGLTVALGGLVWLILK